MDSLTHRLNRIINMPDIDKHSDGPIVEQWDDSITVNYVGAYNYLKNCNEKGITVDNDELKKFITKSPIPQK